MSEQEGKDLYRYVALAPARDHREQPGWERRNGMEGMNIDTDAAGDFGHAEQEIPANGSTASIGIMHDHERPLGYARPIPTGSPRRP